MNRDEAMAQGIALKEASSASPIRQLRDEFNRRAREYSMAIKALDSTIEEGQPPRDEETGEVLAGPPTPARTGIIDLVGTVCEGMRVRAPIAREWEWVEVMRIMPNGDLHVVVNPTDPFDKGSYLNFHSRMSPVCVRD